MPTVLDHLVIGAADLAQGVSFVQETLGVDMPYGGVHEKLGTHNHLMQLGDSTFLEVIAINPQGAPPERPRWYALDDPFVRRRITAQPALLTWVVNTDHIETLLRQAAVSFGQAERIRRGNLSWSFGLPRDGRLLAGGLLPYIIEWQTSPHPSRRMADLGCRLQGIEIHHPYPSWIRSVLASIGAADLAKIKALPRERAPLLKARIVTPAGIRVLTGSAG
jgi:hypothetical protein